MDGHTEDGDPPSVTRTRLVRTLPSMNLITARMTHTRPLTMDTLNRKSSWKTEQVQCSLSSNPCVV